MRVLVGAAARGRPEQYRKEIAAVLPRELQDAEFDFDLNDDPGVWGPALASAEAVILTSRGFAAAAVAAHAAPKLRFVQKLGIDAGRVDLAGCRGQGIAVSVLPDAGHVAVAEHTVAMALAATRNLIPTHSAVLRRANPRGLTPVRTTQAKRHVNWLGLPEADFRLAADLTLGLIGFGEIAREVARRAAGVFAQVVYTKRRRLDAETERDFDVRFLSLDDLLAQSDIVSLHATQPDGAPPVVGRREIEGMRPDAWLINTARGNQVDQAALVEALEKRRLRGAALDVFETEPLLEGSLLGLDNVILTPHTANLMPTGRRFRDALANVAAVRAGLSPSGLVP